VARRGSIHKSLRSLSLLTAVVVVGASALRTILRNPRPIPEPVVPASRVMHRIESALSGHLDALARDQTDSHRAAGRWRLYRFVAVALLTIVSGMLGLMLYRSSSPTTSYPSITVETFVFDGADDSVLPIWEMSVTEIAEAGSTSFDIRATAQASSDLSDVPPFGYVNVTILGVESNEVECPAPCSVSDGFDSGELRVYLSSSPGEWGRDHGDLWFQTLHFRVSRLLPALEQNGVHVSANTPAVTTAKVVPYDTDVYYTHSMASPESYDWVNGPQPTHASDAEGRVTWTLPMESSRLESKSSNGVNLKQAARERNEVFLAGVMLGIAGSTLVAVLLEALAGPVAGQRSSRL
jgi:hypothetical protein